MRSIEKRLAALERRRGPARVIRVVDVGWDGDPGELARRVAEAEGQAGPRDIVIKVVYETPKDVLQ